MGGHGDEEGRLHLPPLLLLAPQGGLLLFRLTHSATHCSNSKYINHHYSNSLLLTNDLSPTRAISRRCSTCSKQLKDRLTSLRLCSSCSCYGSRREKALTSFSLLPSNRLISLIIVPNFTGLCPWGIPLTGYFCFMLLTSFYEFSLDSVSSVESSSSFASDLLSLFSFYTENSEVF